MSEKYLGTLELIGKLTIWQKENLPENELLTTAIDRLEHLYDRIEQLNQQIDELISARNEMP